MQVFVRFFLHEVTKRTTLVDVFVVLLRTRAHYSASPLFARYRLAPGYEVARPLVY